MPYCNLREFLEAVDRCGELKRISGADCNLEMSSIAEIVYREGRNPKPAILFDDIPGYEKGYRTLFGLLSSPRKIAMALGLSEDPTDRVKLLQDWRKKSASLKLVPPEFVNSGPIQTNVMTGDDIDLLKFPSPKFHELDGGRYIGTAHAVIQRDPDAGWVNLGTYRIMVVDRNHLALHIVEGGKHGRLIMEKYFSRGHVMPVAIVTGLDPVLWFVSPLSAIPFGVSEYDYAGGIKSESIKVVEGSYSGLPLPADAEIAIEGECYPGEMVDEGPFGEWTGYYANLGLEPVPEPLIRVKAVSYQDNPIITCAHPTVPPAGFNLMYALALSAGIWNYLEAADIPGIKAVWCHEAGNGQLFNVISIEQLYQGHATQVGLLASQFPKSCGRYTIVVEEDIDPSNLEQVVWAMGTRSNPERSIEILHRCRSASSDPVVSAEEKRKYKVAPKPFETSRAVIDACRPYEGKADWYPIARVSPELRSKTLENWGSILKEYL